VRRCGNLPDEPPLPFVRGPCHAVYGGFDLDAGVVVPASDRRHLERVCRYALRPPLADDRIRLTSEGDVLRELRHRWRDGTTHLRFHPLELLERLASLTARPRINLVLYYGVLAAHATWRPRLPGLGQSAGVVPPSRTVSARETAADVASGAVPAKSSPPDAAGRPGEPLVGAVDAADVRVRRAAVSTMRRTVSPARGDRPGDHRAPHPEPSRAAEGGAEAAAGSGGPGERGEPPRGFRLRRSVKAASCCHTPGKWPREACVRAAPIIPLGWSLDTHRPPHHHLRCRRGLLASSALCNGGRSHNAGSVNLPPSGE
jgi:putative transposase